MSTSFSAEEIFSGLAEFVALPAKAKRASCRSHAADDRIKPGADARACPNATEEELIFVAGGLLEVPPGLVTVLADTTRSAARTSTRRGARNQSAG